MPFLQTTKRYVVIAQHYDNGEEGQPETWFRRSEEQVVADVIYQTAVIRGVRRRVVSGLTRNGAVKLAKDVAQEFPGSRVTVYSTECAFMVAEKDGPMQERHFK